MVGAPSHPRDRALSPQDNIRNYLAYSVWIVWLGLEPTARLQGINFIFLSVIIGLSLGH